MKRFSKERVFAPHAGLQFGIGVGMGLVLLGLIWAATANSAAYAVDLGDHAQPERIARKVRRAERIQTRANERVQRIFDDVVSPPPLPECKFEDDGGRVLWTFYDAAGVSQYSASADSMREAAMACGLYAIMSGAEWVFADESEGVHIVPATAFIGSGFPLDDFPEFYGEFDYNPFPK